MTETDNTMGFLGLPDSQLTKQEIWERKLLDFTLRNNLLNTRLGKRVVPFMSFVIEHLEDHLQEGEDYSIAPCPDTKIEPGEDGMYDSTQQAEQYHTEVARLMESNQLVSYLTETELLNALKYIHRAARTSIEENGANSLFLALGMLKWYETGHGTQPRYAPVLLLPVNIVRKSAGKYVIRKRDEDIMLNITLVELLKQNFGFNLDQLKTLPRDHSGVDVKQVFDTVRQAVAEQPTWTVVEEALLGLFSFSKFVMWNDIHTNADKLHEHPIVASLMEGANKLPPNDEVVDARDIDRHNAPMDFAIPMDVDSSQMEAIVESGKGQSFILHGPPGTGKSQTITNMIANALYQGKRVLFVAEKMAALSVVQSRLEQVGLAPFCLELHSNKATKKHFLQQMEQVLNIVKQKAPATYRTASDELFAERKELIAYMEALHHEEPCGLSLYNCISEYLLIKEDEETTDLPAADKINRDYITQSLEYADKLKAVIDITGQPAAHPLAGLEPVDNSQQTIDSLRQLLADYKTAHEAYRQAMYDINESTPFKVTTAEDLDWLFHLPEAMQPIPFLNGALLTVANDPVQLTQLSDAVMKGSQCYMVRQDLTSRFSENILTIDADAMLQEWNGIEQSWLLPKLMGTNKFVKGLQIYGNIQKDEVADVLGKVKQYQTLTADVEAMRPQMEQLFGVLAMKGHEQWNTMHKTLTQAPRLCELLMKYAHTHNESYKDCAERLSARINDSWTLFQESYTGKIVHLHETYDEVARVNGQINQKTIHPVPSRLLVQRVSDWLGCYDERIRDWYHWGDIKRQLHQLGMDIVARRVERGDDPHTAINSFVKGLYHQLIVSVIDQNPQLRAFNGLLFQQKIEKYRQNTLRFQELSKKELFCRLASRIPPLATDTDEEKAELNTLKRNIASGGRGNSIRTIIDAIPTLLPRLCPCMLMSPISVAQYIDLNNEKFDLVIFDEASQMPTSEAVGAIARGKALTVVGDSKQMPPTSFFSSSQTDEEEAYIDDMESILEDCKTLSMQEYYLSWHYRSKHESLIAFSNSQYYDNKLYTFPSVDDKVTKVSFVKIEGEYDKGHSRSNPAEARAIVNEVIRRLEDPELQKFSIGIVSFSKVQQNLIEDILTDELDHHAALKAVAYNEHEPVFVKNLENVQGDERDVILFSIGYGPDKDGNVSMNFGPLNNSGGERRLNVAVSRARYEMMVFSSMTASQIDLRRTSAKGVEGLRAFLEFAENGHLPAPPVTFNNEEKHVLIDQICEALGEKGYLTTPLVGRSNFKVDIAVSSPDNPDNYLLGIMCDGNSYYETKTTRDREIVQPAILHMLHWRTMRVYSIDWYANRDKVLSQIIAKIKK